MHRLILPVLLGTAMVVLIACQPEPTPQETRLLRTNTILTECIRTQCDTLNLDRGALTDFSVIARLDHVELLRMSWTDFDNLNDIASMTQLKELHISSTQISDLSKLDVFKNLDILHLQWSANISDFSPIAQLPQLKELALGGNNVGDMAFIADLPNLEGLSLVNGSVTSFEALHNHPSLARLDLEATELPDDISALLTIGTLHTVSIRAQGRTVAQQAVVDELRQRGVTVDDLIDAVVVIC